MTAMMPSMSGASLADMKMLVGPSAPPMMPMEAASGMVNSPVASAPQNAAKMPIWAAAPSSSVLGFAIIGPKSVPAPSPRNIRGGRIFQKARP